MDTHVRTPQAIFLQPQRLIVPLFQRPYVWGRENQWEPLWEDVQRLTERSLSDPNREVEPHFLGAVVLQQVQKSTGSLQQRVVIDGQQRLTTLQILLDALHAELLAVDAIKSARRVESLVANDDTYWEQKEDRFNVWPTNRDRAAFNAVMAATPPVAYDQLEQRGARLVEAHRFFAERARAWLRAAGPEAVLARAAAVEKTVRDHLQLVVIDLKAEENAQEIFETLNARGSQLTAADLIKNFVFQRVAEAGVPVEAAYESHWREFETAFWEAEISAGRAKQPRVSVFLNHWLIAQTGEEVVAREVFARFKQYASSDAAKPMDALLERLHRAAGVYRAFVHDSLSTTGALDRRGMFAYRTSVLESEIIKPLVLALLDPEQPPIPEPELHKAFNVIESWLVRRMLVRATSKAYNGIVADLVKLVRSTDRAVAGTTLEESLRSQTGDSRYWPDDDEVRRELTELPAYKRIGRGRLRMVLEAIEDHLRGWSGTARGLGGERVGRGTLNIEHILPRKWQAHWPLTSGVRDEAERDRLLHTLGNLTLLTGRLNSTVSNGPWTGKREALQTHDVLVLNRDLLKSAGDTWADDAIRARTGRLVDIVLAIWPVPKGHRVAVATRIAPTRRRVELIDLIVAGFIEAGATLYARPKKLRHRTAKVLQDGRVEVDGEAFTSLSSAAAWIAEGSWNGWKFFSLDSTSKGSLLDLWRRYVDELAVDAEEDDDDDSNADQVG